MKLHQPAAAYGLETRERTNTAELKRLDSAAHRPGAPGRSSPLSLAHQVLDATCNALSQLLILFNYLMHALPRKFELIRNKAKRFSAAMQIQNSRVSVLVRLRSWTQRAPLPIANLFKNLNLVYGKLTLAATLPKISNPRTKRQRGAIDVLHVGRGNSAMSFARDEVIECCNSEVETRDVVHARDINTDNPYNK